MDRILSKVAWAQKGNSHILISNVHSSSLCQYVYTRVGIRVGVGCETTKTTRVGEKVLGYSRIHVTWEQKGSTWRKKSHSKAGAQDGRHGDGQSKSV